MERLTVIILFLAAICVSSQALAENETLQQVYQNQLSKLQWTDVSIEFRPVTEKSVKGSQAMVVQSSDAENGKTYYVGKSPILGIRDVNNIDVTYNPNDQNMLRLLLRFSKDGRKTLQEYTSKHVGEMMGVIVDGQLRLVAHIRQPLVNGKVQVYGFTPAEAVDIAQRYYKPKLELARQIQETQNKK